VGASTPRWGWHQLEPAWAARLVADAALPVGALVIDVGAGHGALAGPLIAAGARVIAVEWHPARVRYLRRHFGDRVVVVQADACDLRLPRQPYHVVANPPFGITTALLRRLLQPGSRLRSAHLVLQHQAARRWSGHDAPGRVRWAQTFAAGRGPVIPRDAFRPRPPVDARVLVIRRRGEDGTGAWIRAR
jgi:23S rRNA (adenine-N6)-dimethyltransferase